MRKVKQVIYTLLLLLTSAGMQAKALGAEDPGGAIRGKVTTTDNKPAASVTVVLKGTKRLTTTNDEGSFILKNIPAGTYQLEISLVGYETFHQAVTVEAGKTVELRLQLKISEHQLQEIVVTSGNRNRYAPVKESDYVARLPLKNLENPQVYTTVSKELLQDQAVTDLNGALKNVPGVTLLLEGNNSGGSFSSRGFETQAYLRNGISSFMFTAVDPANLERIEAIKGPSATLFGSNFTSYGGLFNRVTKKPFDSFKGEISYTVGSFDLSRLTADINTPLDSAKKALFRVNIAKHHEGSFQDAGFEDRLFIAPSFSYQVNDKLSFLIDAEIYREKCTTPFRFFPETSPTLTTPQQLHFDYNRSFTSNDLTAENPTTNVFAQVNYKISDKWKSQTTLSVSNTSNIGIFSWNSVLPGDTTVLRYSDPGTDITNTFEIQQNFTGDVKTGSVRHRVLAGLDVLGYSDNSSYGFVPFDTVRINGADPEYSRLNNNSLNAILATTPYSHDIVKKYDYAAYASDVINITDMFIAMVSLRADYFDNKGDQDVVAGSSSGAYTQLALSPKFGLVYQVVKDKVALFGNYMNGFTNEDGHDHNHHPFKPEQAYQLEGGAKLDLFNGKLTSTLSYYDIKVNDVLRMDPDFPDFNIQDGTQYSKGFEAEVIANPFVGFNIVAGYAHNDSRYENIDPLLNGYRPASAGPADIANLWLSYRLTRSNLKGLGLGFGGNYASSNNIINESDGVFTLPSYTVLNAAVFYDQPKYRFSVKMNNISNKQYWVGWGTIIPQMPRNISASLAVKF